MYNILNNREVEGLGAISIGLGDYRLIRRSLLKKE